MLQSHEPDQCCGKHISKALRAEELDTAAEWTCPRCGVPCALAILSPLPQHPLRAPGQTQPTNGR